VLGLGAATVSSSAEETVPLPSPRPANAPKASVTVASAKAVPAKATVELPKAPAGGYTHGRVIILRGLANIWSRGMDVLAKKFEAQGVEVTLENHSKWRQLANQAIADYKKDKNVAPIIIIGHSLGGDAALVMSNWMVQNGVPVRLIVVFDAVSKTHPVMPGVQEVINFYKPAAGIRSYGQKVEPSSRFNGTIDNVDLTGRREIDHLNIDKEEQLQDEALAKSLAILKAGG
jgi:thioesterase domain-containing protein